MIMNRRERQCQSIIIIIIIKKKTKTETTRKPLPQSSIVGKRKEILLDSYYGSTAHKIKSIINPIIAPTKAGLNL